MEREWLDMASLDEGDAAGAVDETPAVPAPRDRMAPALLILLAIGWTGFALFVATDGFARAPALAAWPALIATIAMPPTLLAVLLMVWLRSGRAAQARFAWVPAAPPPDNAALVQLIPS